MNCGTPGFLDLHYFLEFAYTRVHWVSDAIQWSHPLSLPSPQSFPASGSFPMSWLALHIRWPKYWSFSFCISPSNEYSGLISFSIDWFDLFAIQGTLRSLLQHHSSKASILWSSAFFMVQHSHLYMTTGKTTALTIQTFYGKMTSSLFNIPSRLVIAFLRRSKCLLISQLQSPSVVTLEPKRIKSVAASPFFPLVFCAGEGNGNPLWYSFLENPMDSMKSHYP